MFILVNYYIINGSIIAMKVLKIVIIGLMAMIVVIYSGLVVIDSNRLQNQDNFGEKPIVTISESKKINGKYVYEKYKGLGYSVEYEYANDSGEMTGKSAEVRLFGKLIGAWIE